MTQQEPSAQRQLYKMPNGSLFEVVERTAELVRFHAQGGGIERTLSVAEFDANFTKTELPPFKPGFASGDWMDDGVLLACYYNGTRWNGWSMPQFELEVGLKLCELMPDLRYDKERDAFLIGDEDGECEFLAEMISVDGRTITVYPIGAGFWCWN
jgi:hypothetical protein